MELNIIKINPTENMTVLVKDPVAREIQPKVAELLMRYSSVHAEQVGYIESPSNKKAVARLQMMGGEFCANASLSLAGYLIAQQQISVGECRSIKLEVSGSDELIICQITKRKEDYLGCIKMPAMLGIECVCLSLNKHDVLLQRVVLSGINHYLFEQELIMEQLLMEECYSYLQPKIDDDEATSHKKQHSLIKIYTRQILEQLITTDLGDAFGLLFIDQTRQNFVPVIYVRKTKTLIWERSCISGTAALAYANFDQYLANTRDFKASYRQPGGTVHVEMTPDGLYISASIKIVLEGTAYLTL